ncbi:hypothetical protein [Pseudomonas sp. CFBP 13719]|nr:hypothetical protein [Pseudomonas sp. CFBP 13719]MBD8615514.1 hypothetical protein [Pseudomonas putida]MBD8681834.1 hypothetical protein [Pseudomonas sp. CFBP 13719]
MVIILGTISGEPATPALLIVLENLAMTIDKISLGVIVALMLGTALATPPAHADQTEMRVTHDRNGALQSSVETFVMYAKDSRPDALKCLQVQRWVASIDTYADDKGNTQSVPMVKQASRSSVCTLDARPYEDSWQASQRMIPGNKPADQLK